MSGRGRVTFGSEKVGTAVLDHGVYSRYDIYDIYRYEDGRREKVASHVWEFELAKVMADFNRSIDETVD